MKIAVLSGKGGTGKTFVSVNLACVADKSLYVDCDVEEPNGHLFLKPDITETTMIEVIVPVVDMEKCTGCKTCVNFCKYNALAYVKDELLIFNEICHSCGGCILLCPEKALAKRKRVVGKIEEGQSLNVSVLTGTLNTGEISGVPIIKDLLKKIPENLTTIIDCPPGSGCAVMESISDADYCLLVAEPTLFGMHNLAMIYDLVKLFNKPFGVVLNKCLEDNNPSETFCIENDIKILAKIPFDEELGKLNSEGFIVARENQKYGKVFKDLLEVIE